uniref:Cullin 9 n=1 Tax=Varanus komodoensis TaxID=61221 RepID=A0A8D2L9A9_VARKO
MVIEKQKGNVPVLLGPQLQACPAVLIQQCHSRKEHIDYLIHSNIPGLENDTGSSTGASSTESQMEHIQLWMSAADAYANCPSPLGKRKPKEQQAEKKTSSVFPSDVTMDEASLNEMKADVRTLVLRATRQMASPTVPQTSILHTIHVLSAYASIGSLVGVFKETGALNMLMKMLCHEEKQIRRSAGKMLRALASHDAGEDPWTVREPFGVGGGEYSELGNITSVSLVLGSRAYVLLSLSQQDGIEQHMDFDSCYTLLELFAETTSSKEHCMSFEGIPLPQIPGKLLFSLVKRYLCATSLMDKLTSTAELKGEHQCSGAVFGGKSRIQCEFDFSMAMAHLISELMEVMGWNSKGELQCLRTKQPRVGQSIFQPHVPSCSTIPSTAELSEKKTRGFKSRSAFLSRNSYAEYIQEKLARGMRVRMLEDYEKVCAGDEGEFLQSTDGTPPVQVYWEYLGRTYWVHWHMIEIVGSARHAEQKAQEKLSSLTETLRWNWLLEGGLYSLPYLMDQVDENSGTLSRAEWWELLFFIKKLELHEQQEVLLELDEEGLIQLSMSVELAQQVLHLLDQHCQGCTRNDLHSSHVYLKYSFSKGAAEQSCKNMDMISANCGGPSEAMASEKPKKESLSAEVPSPASSGTEKTDTQLINELLKAEGLSFPDTLDEKAKGKCWIVLRGMHSGQHGGPRCCAGRTMSPLLCLQVVQEGIGFLHCLAALDKDCAVMMCCLGTKEALTKVLEKHGPGLPQVAELEDLLSSSEKYASLYKKMTASILAGCIQVSLVSFVQHPAGTQGEQAGGVGRGECPGCSVEVKEDKCWQRVEVSSNPQQASKLVDGNPSTYWESNGSSCSHYINVYMHRGVTVRQMSLLVAMEDSCYMPARILVLGRESASGISTRLNMVCVPPSASRVTLLENMSCFWPIIQIKIKRCQLGGIDTRVRGLEVLGPKPTFWPVFKEQLCRRTYLFYTTKAHTWCQEISEDRMQLLQLFSRLNSALRHEQVFADRFLPDDEAAQALGKTCWEALITPLVQSITSPDPSGISPLSWLLSQYLENVEVARRTKSRAAVFNSRVRRLSHLLVHVDSSSPEPEDLKPPVKSSECPPGSWDCHFLGPAERAGRVWVLVRSRCSCCPAQVKRFLESSWQAPDFVERYCSTYQRLRTAMEELFGQQMSFMLALCHGFSGGLLQLSFLTAMHVSEQFARYIDRWIQESWANSGNVESLQRLQQSLEPILFLAGLELANTFEHFYRYYLGDRLLSQGKTWLETAVVEHIGLCFPNRFPQQMLKNLSELEQQQQQFHLFQLQQLDKHLLELDQRGKQEEEAEEEEEAVVSAGGRRIEEEADVKVLALSPRCWTISPLCYLEEPARPLLASCARASLRPSSPSLAGQSRFGQEHTKPRRLQWTWLGHAELEHQGCVLHVSTLQMYILLCFNDAEVSVEVLSQETGLSPVLLSHGVLTRHGGLNEVTLSQVSGQHLWLLPKQTYLNVEENEASALERKRNIICCLLIQILKEEKEIHIDSLVFRVMQACQKQAHGCAFRNLSPFCSSTDVLSCILRMVNQGSIRRQDDHPELLKYLSTELPAPAEPKNQPRVVFQTMQIKKAPSMPCGEKKHTFSTFR